MDDFYLSIRPRVTGTQRLTEILLFSRTQIARSHPAAYRSCARHPQSSSFSGGILPTSPTLFPQQVMADGDIPYL
jgi:hypothetical protein